MTGFETPVPRDLVVDASVATKWLLRDEDDLESADHLLHEHDAANLALAAPQQIEVEVANAIRKAVLNGRISKEEGEQALSQWLGPFCARLQFAPNVRLLPQALVRSIELGITLFDALYLVLAEELGAQLVMADARFMRSPAAVFPFVHSLSGYAAKR